MSRKTLALLGVPLLVAGAALARPPVSEPGSPPPSEQAETPETTAKLSEAFSVLQTVTQAGTDFSKMADKRAKSDLVKNYAGAMVDANTGVNEKLLRVAKQEGIKVAPLDPQTEYGKSVLDRMKAEGVLLGSLEGDAWDKEYMVLVTNTQQSVIRMLRSHQALAKDKEVKQFLGELITLVENRLKTSQDIMAKVYGDKV